MIIMFRPAPESLKKIVVFVASCVPMFVVPVCLRLCVRLYVPMRVVLVSRFGNCGFMINSNETLTTGPDPNPANPES